MAWRDLEVRRRFGPPPPALLVGLAVLVLALSALPAWMTVQAVQAGRAVSADRLCAVDRSGPCLDRVVGELSGPHRIRKSVNREWWVSGSASGRLDVGPRASAGLERWDGSQVAGLTFDGDLVAVRTPDGSTFTSLDVGVRGAVWWGCWTIAAVAGGVGLLRVASRRRGVSGSWWRPGGPADAFVDIAVLVAILVPVFQCLAMTWGAPWWGASVVLAGFAVVVLVDLVRAKIPSDRRRHARHWSDRHPQP